MGFKNNRVSDLRKYRELRAKTLGAIAAPSLGEMHRKEIVSAQVFAFAPNRINQGGPVLMRDLSALAPLLDPVLLGADVGRHLGQRPPRLKQLVERSHAPKVASDGLSGQAPPKIPMTDSEALRTIGPMGRGVTPARFRSDMAKRLSSARVVAGYQTKKQAADALGVGLDRYEKWETGRTPVPAQYVAAVCDLFGVDANYLFSVQPKVAASKKTA